MNFGWYCTGIGIFGAIGAMVEFGEERKLMAIRLGAQFAIRFTDDPSE